MQDRADTLERAGRSLIGSSRYVFGAEPHEAPDVVSCQTFVWWLYGESGITIPHLISAQIQLGSCVRTFQEGKCGDLVFARGLTYNFTDEGRARDGVGHVGVLTARGTVLHASSRARTVTEESLECFLVRRDRFRGIYRILKG